MAFIGVSFGRFDVMLAVYVSSPKILLNFTKNKLSLIDGIHSIETLVIAEVKKRILLAPPEPVGAQKEVSGSID